MQRTGDRVSGVSCDEGTGRSGDDLGGTTGWVMGTKSGHPSTTKELADRGRKVHPLTGSRIKQRRCNKGVKGGINQQTSAKEAVE